MSSTWLKGKPLASAAVAIEAASPQARSHRRAREEAFTDLFRTHSPYVARLAVRILGRREEADEIVQETFLQAHRKLHSLRQSESVRSWLARIAVRLAYRRLRRVKFQSLFCRATDAPYRALAGSEATPEERLTVARMYQALDRLPAKQRIPWVLRRLHGESIASVMDICGCSRATLHRWLTSADETLKLQWGEDG